MLTGKKIYEYHKTKYFFDILCCLEHVWGTQKEYKI